MTRALGTKLYMFLVILVALGLYTRVDWPAVSGQLYTCAVLAALTTLVIAMEVRLPNVGAFSLEAPLLIIGAYSTDNPYLPLLVLPPIFLGKRLMVDRRLDLIVLFDACQLSLSYVLAALVMRAVCGDREFGLEEIFGFLLASLAYAFANSLFLVGYYLVNRPAPAWGKLLEPHRYQMVAVLMTLPLGLLTLLTVPHFGRTGLYLAALPLAFSSYAFRQYFDVRARNRALEQAQQRQQFLTDLAGMTRGTIETSVFLTEMIERLKAIVPCSRMAALLMDPSGPGVRQLTHGSVGRGAADIEAWLRQEMELGRLIKVAAYAPGESVLGPPPRRGLKVPLATTELVFGVLLFESDDDKELADADRDYLALVGGQLSALLQDQLLKHELYSSNRRLEQRNGQLSRILEVSDLLKGHDPLEQVFGKIVQAIRESSGFRVVLLSIYRPQIGVYERVAQVGLDDRWDEVRAQQRPADSMNEMLNPRYRLSNSYYIPHQDYKPAPLDVLSMKPQRVAEGEWHALDILLVPMTNSRGELIGVISVDDPEDRAAPTLDTVRALEILANQAVSAIESAAAYETIQKQAIVDGLTDIHNHRYFQEALAKECDRAKRLGEHFALLFLDLDNFKTVNDTHGHPVGDRVLKEVANCLKATIRDTDLAARYGGEEFTIIYPGLGRDEAIFAAERLRRRISAARVPLEGGVELSCTVSIGIALYPQHSATNRGLIAAADAALFAAKRAGKNQVQMAA
jgi:diguanylate cyclase (GGDEF)-like protein